MPHSRPALLLLLNSTKLMDLDAPPPPRVKGSAPVLHETAAELVGSLRVLPTGRWRSAMDVSDKLADAAKLDLARWGTPDNRSLPAWYAFTGLLYQALDPRSLDAAARRRARSRLRILSGLYGILGPLDLVESYRLEMGCPWAPGRAPNMTAFWKKRLTDAVNAELKDGEPIVSVASLEYMKALDMGRLRGPVVSPVFKEMRPDGTLKTASVHAKRARGAFLRHALVTGARKPADLLDFGALDWTASTEPPDDGPWLFTRPVRD